MRVLVVDDSATSRNIFKETLESFSLKVAVAESGAKAIDAVTQAAGQGKRLRSDYHGLENALSEALTASRSLDPSAAKKISAPDELSIPQMPFDLAKKTAERLGNAVDMGNISELKAIAKQIRSESDTYGDFSDTIGRLAEDFDLEGIQKLGERLRTQAEK